MSCLIGMVHLFLGMNVSKAYWFSYKHIVTRYQKRHLHQSTKKSSPSNPIIKTVNSQISSPMAGIARDQSRNPNKSCRSRGRSRSRSRRLSLEAPHGVLHELHVDSHKLCHEGLQVVDCLVTLLEAVLVGGSDLGRSIRNCIQLV